jgi:hypothetical protein
MTTYDTRSPHMPTYEVTADLPRKHDTFTARSTKIDGKTFTARAVEFSDIGGPVKRITLRVHPHNEGDPDIDANLTNGSVALNIGDLAVWLPEGYEAEVVAALTAAIEEQARQAEAGTNVCVVAMTGSDPTGYSGDDEVAA